MTSKKPKLRIVSGSKSQDLRAHSVEQKATGDNTARVAELYEQYRQALLNYLISIMPGGRQDASEVLHETYIRLLRRENLDGLEENPKAYIFAVATNLVRDNMRSRRSRREEAHVSYNELEFESESQEMTPVRAANWEESMALLKQALMALKPQTRQVFLLGRFEEMTCPEIAVALKVSTRTVERHMSAACKALQNSLPGLRPEHN